MAVDLGSAFGRIVIDGSGATRGLNRTGAAFGVFSKGALAGAGALLVLGGALASSVGVAARFEQAIADVGAVADATAGEMAELREQALELGESTKFSATEVAGAQGELVRAGVSVAEVLGGALPGALALAAAGDLELADAARIAANAMNLFGLAGEDVSDIADTLAAAANATTADVADFGMALSQGGAAAKAAGLDLRETTVVLGALAEAGVKNSDAGTSMKAAFTQLLGPTAKASATMREAGLSVLDANGALADAPVLALRLRDATEDMTKAERVAFLTRIAGTDGLRTLLALVDAGPDRLLKMGREFEREGAAAEVAKARQDTFSSSLEQLGGAVETAQIRLGSALTPALRTAAEAVTGLTNAASNSGRLEAIGAAAGNAVGAVQGLASGAASLADTLGALPGVGDLVNGSMGALAAGLGVLAANKLRTAIAGGKLVQTLTSMTTAFRAGGLGAVAMSNPIGALAVGVGVAVGALVALHGALDSGGGASDRFASAQDRVKAAADGARDAVNGVRDAVDGYTNAHRSSQAAALAVERALVTYREAVAAEGPASLRAREAAVALATARDRAAQATREEAKATDELVATTTGNVSALAKLATAQGDASGLAKAAAEETRANARAMGLTAGEADKLALRIVDLGDESLTTAQRQERVRDASLDAAKAIKGTGPAADFARDALEALGTATPGQLEAFNEDLATGLRLGEDEAETRTNALRTLIGEVGNAGTGPMRLPGDVEKGGEEARKAGQEKADAIALEWLGIGDARVDLGPMAQSVRDSGAQVVASARYIADATRAQLNTVDPRVRKSPSPNDYLEAGLAAQRALMERGLWATEATAERGASRIRAELAGLGGALGDDAIAGARTRQEARLDAAEEANERRRDVRDRRKIMRAVEVAEAAFKRADAEEKGAAREALADARRARAADDLERREARRLAAARRPAEARLAVLDRIETLRGALEEGMSDLASTAVGALERAFASRMTALGDALDEDLQAIDDRLARRIAEINASPAAQAVTALRGAIDAGRERIRARTEQDRRDELTGARAETDAQVARMQDVLARVRTESERVAATALLDQALAAQRTAAGELAEFEEGAGLDAAERMVAVIEKGLDDQRTAEANAAAAAKVLRQAAYDDLVRDETAQHTDRVARLERQLGDLAELIRENTPASRAAAQELVGAIGQTLDDPAFRAAFAESGELLGLSFSRGLARARREVGESARGLADEVARFLKMRSPAEAGPLAHDFADSGAVIPLDLARGMRSGREAVAAEARRLAAAAAVAVLGTAGAGGPGGAVASGGMTQSNTFNVTSAPEDLRAWGERAGWAMRVAGGVH